MLFRSKYYGNGALTTGVLDAVYDTTVSEKAAIFQADWKNLSTDDFNEIIRDSSRVNLSRFLKDLSEEDLKLLIDKDTALSQPYFSYDWNPKTEKISNYTEEIYYKYLLENDFSTSGATQIYNNSGSCSINRYLSNSMTAWLLMNFTVDAPIGTVYDSVANISISGSVSNGNLLTLNPIAITNDQQEGGYYYIGIKYIKILCPSGYVYAGNTYGSGNSAVWNSCSPVNGADG